MRKEKGGFCTCMRKDAVTAIKPVGDCSNEAETLDLGFDRARLAPRRDGGHPSFLSRMR